MDWMSLASEGLSTDEETGRSSAYHILKSRQLKGLQLVNAISSTVERPILATRMMAIIMETPT